MDANTDIADPEQFRDLVVKEQDGSLIRLSDVADVELGSENNNQIAYYAGSPATYVAIELSPGANPLKWLSACAMNCPGLKASCPVV